MANLPRLILIANRFTIPDIARKTLLAVQAGVEWVHLRDHDADERLFEHDADVLYACVQSVDPETMVSANRRLDTAESLSLHLHTSAKGPSIPSTRSQLGDSALIGYSAHTFFEALKAKEEGADYIFFSPIFPTTSKPGHKGVGLDALATCCSLVSPMPVFALGGVSSQRATDCLEAGAYGIVVLSGILQAPDGIERSVQRYQNSLMCPI